MNTWLEIIISIPTILAVPLLVVILVLVVLGAVYIWRMVSRNKKLTRELEEISLEKANWEASREEIINLLYNVSHDVANPLQSILTNLDNMEDLTPEDMGLWHQNRLTIISEIKRLINITRNIQQIPGLLTDESRIYREPVNIKAIIEDVMMSQIETAEAKGVRLIYDGPERPPRVLGDREQLQQVIANLVNNGIKYSDNGNREVLIQVGEDQNKLCVRVIDNGIGIPEDDLPFMFERGFRAPGTRKHKISGSGYGLFLTKRIVEHHGGKINVKSQQGEGTTFSIELPIFNPSNL